MERTLARLILLHWALFLLLKIFYYRCLCMYIRSHRRNYWIRHLHSVWRLWWSSLNSQRERKESRLFCLKKLILEPRAMTRISSENWITDSKKIQILLYLPTIREWEKKNTSHLISSLLCWECILLLKWQWRYWMRLCWRNSSFT